MMLTRTGGRITRSSGLGRALPQATNTRGVDVLSSSQRPAVGGRRVIFFLGDDADAKADVGELFESS